MRGRLERGAPFCKEAKKWPVKIPGFKEENG